MDLDRILFYFIKKTMLKLCAGNLPLEGTKGLRIQLGLLLSTIFN